MNAERDERGKKGNLVASSGSNSSPRTTSETAKRDALVAFAKPCTLWTTARRAYYTDRRRQLFINAAFDCVIDDHMYHGVTSRTRSPLLFTPRFPSSRLSG